MTALIYYSFGQVSTAMDRGASGPEAFNLLLRLHVTHFDRVDTAEGYTKLHIFGVCTGTPSSELRVELRALVSAVTESECGLSPGTGVGLQGDEMPVNEWFPTFMPTLYPGSKATDPRVYASLDAMWRAFSDLAYNKTPAVNGGKHISLPVSSTGAWSSARWGPGPPAMGTTRAECRTSRLLGRRDRSIIRSSCRLMMPPTPVSTKCSTAGP